MHWIPYKNGDAEIIAVDGNKVVGSLFYGKEKPSDKTLKGAIEVRPEYRRQGIATGLYVWAEQLSSLNFLPDEPHTGAARSLWGQKNRPFGLRASSLTGPREELKSIAAHWKLNSVDISAYLSNGDKELDLHRIVVPKASRGEGLGSQAMRDLTAFADKHKITMTLTPSTDFGASSVERLKRFYSQFGFVNNKGRHADHAISASMYRLPR